MSKHFVLIAYAAAALAGPALAQTAQPGAPTTPAPAAQQGAQAPANPGQSLPGWGGTPSPQAPGQGPAPQAQAPGTTQPPGQPATPGQPPVPGGLVTVAPAAVVTYYAVQPADMTASNLMRTEVRNLQDERIGRIEDLVIGNGREITAVVVGVGGFLGIGERYAALPPSAIVLTRAADGSMRAVVDATRDQLRTSPEFRFEGNVRR